ncbi:MAG: DUF2147 domain-containing protein [Betaproteobacteria bacterium]
MRRRPEKSNPSQVWRSFEGGSGQKNDKESIWEAGRILDPEKGEEYRFKIRLIDQGRTLQVRGYLGPFWRTQTWTRQ